MKFICSLFIITEEEQKRLYSTYPFPLFAQWRSYMRCVDLSSDVHMDQIIVAINYWDHYLTTQIVLPLTRFQIN